MPVQTIVVSALVVAAFSVFGLTLLVNTLADWRTSKRRKESAS